MIRIQRIKNHTHYPVNIFHQIIIPKPQYYISFRFKEYSALIVIFFLLQMPAAINFNNKLLIRRTEVNNVTANRMLPPEMDIARLMGA